jgi:ATP-dependent DNA helicase RecG
MTLKELDKLIRIGEGFALEFKLTPSHLGREICAFANASGGRILVGVDDLGHITGLKNLNRTKSEIQSIARNIDPPVLLDFETVENILVVTVPNGPNKPYSANGIFYIREAANTQQMKRDEIREFFFREGLIRFDEQPCRNFDMRRDFDSRKYRDFVQITAIPSGLRKEDVLRNLKVLTDQGMTNAGALLFGKKVSQFFLQASLTCALFQGTSKSKVLDHAVYQGSITENYQSALSYLMSHLNTEYVIKGGPREEILELPEEALREALLNALAHRDYRSTSDIQVHIFRDRVEISNPGGLVSGLKIKDLGRVSRPRNLLLFSLMARMELVEHIGSGIKRIRDAMAAYGLDPPLIEANFDWFAVTFQRKGFQDAIEKPSRVQSKAGQGGGVNEGIREGVSEGIETLFEFIRKAPGLRAPQLAEILKVPVKTLEKRLYQLKKNKEIEFKGSTKFGGYWAKRAQGGGVNGGVNEGMKKVLEFIRSTPGLRAPQISRAVGVPVSTLEKWLKKLKDSGEIVFKGSFKSGGYRINQ